MRERLTPATLETAPAAVRKPRYDRNAVTPAIVHLGIGAFHRAHQAVVVDDVLATDPRWGIIGASLRRPDTKQALGPQGGLYTVFEKDGDDRRLRVIGAVVRLIDGVAEREALLAAMTAPTTQIVSLTITEKGYGYSPAADGLDVANAEVAADLAAPRAAKTATGLLVEALRQRKAAGLPPFTVLSCDNLPHNGEVTRKVVTGFAERVDPALGAWVRENVRFPGTMIDRIVPATTDADREEVAETLGLSDAWPVVAEPFLQWVIEDKFVGERPPFERGGAQFVADVAPYERMKLRMLNGSHSMMAYLGYLSGKQFIADVMAEPDFVRFVRGAMTEDIAPTLNMPLAETDAYRESLLRRFENKALRHRTYQIAMDGSQKLPQRLLGTIADRIASGAGYTRLALGVAAWMIYARGEDLAGQPIAVQDPLAAEFAAIPVDGMVDAYLRVDRVFPPALARNTAFRNSLQEMVELLRRVGAAEAVRRIA